MVNERQIRRTLIDVCRRIQAQGWVANHDGNVSVRLSEHRLLITPTAMSKGDITEDMLLIVDFSGKKISGSLQPFSELNLHLAAYRTRPDIQAVIHAHPPTATGFAVAGVPLSPPMMPEVVVSLGDEIPTAPFAMPGTRESETAISSYVERFNAFLLANHGAITVGDDVLQAYLRMELVEHYAKINLVALQVGGVKTLCQSHIDPLLEKRHKAGLEPPEPHQKASLSPSAPRPDQDLKEIISREIARVLKS